MYLLSKKLTNKQIFNGNLILGVKVLGRDMQNCLLCVLDPLVSLTECFKVIITKIFLMKKIIDKPILYLPVEAVMWSTFKWIKNSIQITIPVTIFPHPVLALYHFYCFVALCFLVLFYAMKLFTGFALEVLL